MDTPQNSPRIVVIGSSNTDMVVKMERLPKPGETLLGGEFSQAAGGKGANQAVAAARAGGDVTFVARVGRDALGEAAMATYQKEGIHTDAIFRDETAPSGVALIFVGSEGENSIAVAPGANGRLSPADLEQAGEAIRAAGAVLLQLEIPLETVTCAAAMATKARVPVILNPAPARHLPADLLALVDVLTPNESEAAALAGVPVNSDADAQKAASILLERGVRAVVITLGSRGALLATREGMQLLKSFHVEPVDTIAAGDTFNGALAVALAEKQPLLEAVRFAQAAAAISVTRRGAQESAPRREEIDGLLKHGMPNGHL